MENKRIIKNILKNKYLQEYFIWICNQEDKNYKKIICFKTNIKNIYFILEMEQLNLIEIKTINNIKYLYITSIGNYFYKKYFCKEIKDINKYYKYLIKKQYLKEKITLKKYLTEKKYEVKDNDNYYVINKEFSKFYIYFQQSDDFFNKNMINDIYKKTHTLIIIANCPEDKVKLIYLINNVLLSMHKDLTMFIEEGYSYSIVTIKDILLSDSFPKKLPLTSNFLNNNYIKNNNKYVFF